MKKKILSLIITFIVCFGLVVLSAFIFCAEGRDLGEWKWTRQNLEQEFDKIK